MMYVSCVAGREEERERNSLFRASSHACEAHLSLCTVFQINCCSFRKISKAERGSAASKMKLQCKQN